MSRIMIEKCKFARLGEIKIEIIISRFDRIRKDSRANFM